MFVKGPVDSFPSKSSQSSKFYHTKVATLFYRQPNRDYNIKVGFPLPILITSLSGIDILSAWTDVKQSIKVYMDTFFALTH